MATHGPGRPWHTRIRKRDKRTKLVPLRISANDEARWRRILKGLGTENARLATYAYDALLAQMKRDERRLVR